MHIEKRYGLVRTGPLRTGPPSLIQSKNFFFIRKKVSSIDYPKNIHKQNLGGGDQRCSPINIIYFQLYLLLTTNYTYYLLTK